MRKNGLSATGGRLRTKPPAVPGTAMPRTGRTGIGRREPKRTGAGVSEREKHGKANGRMPAPEKMRTDRLEERSTGGLNDEDGDAVVSGR